MDERRAYKEEVEGPAKEAKEAAKAALENVDEEKKAAEKEKSKAAAELELGRIDKDSNGEISPDEVRWEMYFNPVINIWDLSIKLHCSG